MLASCAGSGSILGDRIRSRTGASRRVVVLRRDWVEGNLRNAAEEDRRRSDAEGAFPRNLEDRRNLAGSRFRYHYRRHRRCQELLEAGGNVPCVAEDSQIGTEEDRNILDRHHQKQLLAVPRCSRL